jgi:phosphorylase superfamily protein
MDDDSDLGRFILDYDPTIHQPASDALNEPLGSALPKPVPWPKGLEPVAEPLAHAPSPKDDLSKFKGYDAIVVTWTAAEASALSEMFSPGYPTSSWYQYQNNVESYIPLVTGAKAPFNDRAHSMARYYHTLGLYFPCRIGKAKVLLFKSGLHLAYDGPATPVFKLMKDLAYVVNPKMFITTGTGGGIGKDVSLGDVIIAGTVKFDCKQQFAKESWAKSAFLTSSLPKDALPALVFALTSVNASRIPGARAKPKFFTGLNDTIVTTDFFAYDDSTNHFGLQGLGQCCDMGDAMVARALHDFPNIKFYAIRNASDPQIDNPTKDMATAGKQAASIYARYGGLTTAASVLATWAIIQGEQ